MKKIHGLLEQNSSTYTKWHQHPERSFHHLIVLVLVIVAVFVSISGSIKGTVLSYNEANVISTESKRELSNIKELTNKLLKASTIYKKVEESEKSGALSELASAVSKRKSELKKLINENPRAVLLELLPEDAILRMPPAVQNLLERHISVTGKLTVTYIDSDQSHVEYELIDQQSGKKYKLHLAEGRIRDITGATVKVEGIAIDSELILAASGSIASVQTVTPALATASVTGARNTIVIAFNFSDNTSTPFTVSEIQGALTTNPDSTSNYYQESSYGAVSFPGDVFGWYTIPYAGANSCDTTNWVSAADSAAEASGAVLGNYTSRVYLFPGDQTNCTWNGISTIGGNPSISKVKAQSSLAFMSQLMSHELGHALGMGHASPITCGNKAIDVYGNCLLGWYVPDPVGYPFSEPGKNRFYEYVAYHDVMGEWKSGHFHNNAPHKVDMGWIPDSSIQTVTTSGTYTIAPLETSTSAIQIIKIPKADTGQYYLLEYRQPIGFDAQLPGATVSGIGINVSGLDASIIDPAIDWFITGAKLVDNTPGDYTFNNQTLTDGNTFDDIANGIEITQLSHNASGAVVQINFVSTSCVKDNPTVTISPLSQSGDVGETLTYTVEVKNNNSPACGANTFGLSSFLPPGFSAIFTPASLNLASDSISIVQMEVTSDVGLTDSNNTFSAIATNSVDPTYFGSGSASYVVFTDVTKPVVTIIKPDKRTKVKFNSIPVQATATDDVTVVKMELYINNVLTSQTNTNSLNYVWATQNIAKGKYTVLFKAYDTAGNVGQSSVEIIKDSGAHR